MGGAKLHGLIAGAVATGAVVCGGVVLEPAPPAATWPPFPEAGALGPTGETYTFAVDRLYLGDTFEDGTPYPTAWTSWGFDLDGKTTVTESTDVCTLLSGASRGFQRDGTRGSARGIDNAFGAWIVPAMNSPLLFKDAAPVSERTTTMIRRGSRTLLLQVTGLALGARDTRVGLSATLFPSAPFNSTGDQTPKFTTDEDWPVSADELLDGGIEAGTRYRFPRAYVVDGTFVSGVGHATLTIDDTLGPAYTLPLEAAVIVMDVRDLDIVRGTIAGVVRADDLVADVKANAGRVSRALCGAAFDGVEYQLRQPADILHDGTNRPGTPCDAISLGVGFTARRVSNPTRAVTSARLPDPCDASADVAKE